TEPNTRTLYAPCSAAMRRISSRFSRRSAIRGRWFIPQSYMNRTTRARGINRHCPALKGNDECGMMNDECFRAEVADDSAVIKPRMRRVPRRHKFCDGVLGTESSGERAPGSHADPRPFANGFG